MQVSTTIILKKITPFTFFYANYHESISGVLYTTGNGLKLLLYDEEDEYIESHDSEDLGVKFLPHPHIEPPFLKELGFGAAPGYHYQIALQQREVTQSPSIFVADNKWGRKTLQHVFQHHRRGI